MEKILAIILTIIILCCVGGIVVHNENLKKWDNFDNEELKSNIETAFEQIGFDTSKIENIDVFSECMWGTIYFIRYNDENYYIYAYDDGQIKEIRKNSTAGATDDDVVYSNQNLEFENVDENDIILEEGKLGDYGKYDTYDGKQYIRYYIPEGTYEVKTLLKNSMFYIVKKKIYKNSSGHDESETVYQSEFLAFGATETITINSDCCIELTMDSIFSFTKK